MSLGKIFSSTQKLGPWGLLQKAKNPNFDGPFRGPEGHENILLGKFSVRLKNWVPGAYYKIAKNPNFEGPLAALRARKIFSYVYTDSRDLKE